MIERQDEKKGCNLSYRQSHPPIFIIAGIHNQGGHWACLLCQGTDPHTLINGIWWAPLLCLQLTSHTCWLSSDTQLFVWACCVHWEAELIWSWVNRCITLPHTCPHRQTHRCTVIGLMPTHRAAHKLKNTHSLPLSHTQVHTLRQTDTNHVEQWLQLERVFSWLSVQFSGRAKCGS